MPFLEADGVRLYYETHGPRRHDAPPVVFAHGLGGNHLSWWQQVPHFRDRHRLCVVFDHRGFGRSKALDGRGGDAFADDLLALLDHLEIERAALVAQSMGGWTCLRFALRHPARVERLVMAATHGGIRTAEIDAAWRESRALHDALPPEVHPAAGARMYSEQPELHFLYTEINALNPDRPREDGVALIRAAGSVDPADLASLDIPVLFISGDEDIVIPTNVLKSAQRLIPGAQLEIVEQAGHSVYFERAHVFNARVDRFLAR